MIPQNHCHGIEKVHREEINIKAFHRYRKWLLYLFFWILWCLQYLSAFKIYKCCGFFSHFQYSPLNTSSFSFNSIFSSPKKAVQIIQVSSLQNLTAPDHKCENSFTYLYYNVHCIVKLMNRTANLPETYSAFHLIASSLPLLGQGCGRLKAKRDGIVKSVI